MSEDPVELSIRELKRRARQAPQPGPVLLELGRLCLARQQLDVALEAFRDALTRHPRSATLRFNYGWFAKQAGRPMLALDQYAQALKLGIDRPEEVHLNRANVYSELCADAEAARRELTRALELNPQYLSAWLNLGNLCEQAGDRIEARRALLRCLEIDPNHPAALARLADMLDFSVREPETVRCYARMLALQIATGDPDLAFALGRAAEQRGEFVDAWRFYSVGNSTDRAHGLREDPTRIHRLVEQLERTCTREWLGSFARTQPDTPIFICGSFRSGSTLLEQMLAAHPGFAPAGEREFFPRWVAREFPRYPDGLTTLKRSVLEASAVAYREEWTGRVPAEARLTDKRPDNLFYLGLIKAVFPRARILVTRRDWRDIATSLFATRLGPVAAYATDLRSIRHHLEAEARLTTHWTSVFGPDLQIVDYERLVASPRETLGRALAGLGVSWDERCLEFHALRNSVRTASVWQVRAPLHAGSVGRWRRFESAFAEAFGDSVRD